MHVFIGRKIIWYLSTFVIRCFFKKILFVWMSFTLTKVIYLNMICLLFYSSLSFWYFCPTLLFPHVVGRWQQWARRLVWECAWKQEEVVEHQIQIQAVKHTSAASSARLIFISTPVHRGEMPRFAQLVMGPAGSGKVSHRSSRCTRWNALLC